MDRMGCTDQLVRYSDGRYLTFDPAEVAGCSAAPYATDTRQSAQLHSLRASRLSPPTPPHYARVCVLRWDVRMVRSSQTSTYCACAGGRGAEADLRHVSVSERPTTDIRETCTKFGAMVSNWNKINPPWKRLVPTFYFYSVHHRMS